jgi:hypothetical protein
VATALRLRGYDGVLIGVTARAVPVDVEAFASHGFNGEFLSNLTAKR